MASIQLKGKIRFSDPQKRMFFVTLKTRVDQYFKDQGISPHANVKMVIKTICLFALYLLPFLVILCVPMKGGAQMLLWAIMGLGLAGVGMGVMHDAIHGAYSEKTSLNTFVGYSLNVLGASIFNWKFQHNLLHHTYTNITHMDDDIDDKGILRFSPHTRIRKLQQFQWLYAIGFYGIMSLYWIVAKDFIQFYKYRKNGVNQKSNRENRDALVRIIILKTCYFFFIIALPILLGIPYLQVLGGFMLMHFVAGVVLTLIFQLAHTIEETSHPMPDSKGNIDNEWAIHQLQTTANFSRKNKWLSWYVGGLNFQVEHHLFPKICHVHYPAIAPIVKETAEEFGIPYLEHATLLSALRSHFNLLYKFGRLPKLDEALG
jgi:linoleoyl-CoA desaturase